MTVDSSDWRNFRVVVAIQENQSKQVRAYAKGHLFALSTGSLIATFHRLGELNIYNATITRPAMGAVHTQPGVRAVTGRIQPTVRVAPVPAITIMRSAPTGINAARRLGLRQRVGRNRERVVLVGFAQRPPQRRLDRFPSVV